MALKIIGLAFSTYTRSVLMTCLEKGVAHTLLEDGLMPTSALRKPAHLKRHPFAKIPVIDHDGFVLYETAAICGYIDDAFDGPALVPSAPDDRGRMRQWMSAINAYIDPQFIRQFVLHHAFPRGEDGKVDQDAIAAALPGVRRGLRILNRAYDETGYLVAGRLTLADILIAPILAYVARTPEGPDLIADAPNVGHALDTLGGRPSFKALFSGDAKTR